MDYFTKRKLQKCNPTEVKFFTLAGQTLYVRMSDAYDGDTCTLILPIHKTLQKLKCRLHRIDTAEMRTNDPLEKQYAIRARERLLMFKDMILVACISEADKYGRYLVDLFTQDGTCINDLLVYEGLAYEYKGDTKREFQDWVKDSDNKPRNLTGTVRAFQKPCRRGWLFSCFQRRC